MVGKRSGAPLRHAARVRAAAGSRRLAVEQPADPFDGAAPRLPSHPRRGRPRGPAREGGATDRLPSLLDRRAGAPGDRGHPPPRPGPSRLPGLPAGPPRPARPGGGALLGRCGVRPPRAGRHPGLDGAALQSLSRCLALRPDPGAGRGMSLAADAGAGRRQGPVVLVGAGLGGSLMAILLGRAGYTVRGFELRPDLRAGPPAGGRSINLALSARGLHALEQVGLARDVLAMAVPMRGRMIHAQDGRIAFQPYGTKAEQVNNSVSRHELNVILLNAAERLPCVRFTFDHKCQGVDVDSGEVMVLDTRTGDSSRLTGDVVIGADGAFSVVRRQLF